MGVNFGSIQRHGAHLEHPHFTRQEQNFDEQRFDVLEKPPPEAGDGVMVWVIVRGDEAEGHGIIGRPFQLAAGKQATRIAVDRKAQQRCRMVGPTKDVGVDGSTASRASIGAVNNQYRSRP